MQLFIIFLCFTGVLYGNAYKLHTINHLSRISSNFEECRSNHRTPLFASTGPVITEKFHTVTITQNRPECEGLREIVLDVTSEVFNAYTKPGQYIKVRAAQSQGKPSFYAIASPPATPFNSDSHTKYANKLHLLVKESPNNEFLLSSKEVRALPTSFQTLLKHSSLSFY